MSQRNLSPEAQTRFKSAQEQAILATVGVLGGVACGLAGLEGESGLVVGLSVAVGWASGLLGGLALGEMNQIIRSESGANPIDHAQSQTSNS